MTRWTYGVAVGLTLWTLAGSGGSGFENACGRGVFCAGGQGRSGGSTSASGGSTATGGGAGTATGATGAGGSIGSSTTGGTGGSTSSCGCTATGSLWITLSEIASLPTTGSAWDEVLSTADATFDPKNNHGWTNPGTWDTSTLAAALVAVRLGLEGGGASYRANAADAIMVWARDPNWNASSGRLTYPSRNVPAIVIAADLIDFPTYRPSDEAEFRRFISDFRFVCLNTHSDFHQAADRPNNHGTMSFASMAAITSYLVKYGAVGCGTGQPDAACAADRPGQFTQTEHVSYCDDPQLNLDAIARIFRGWTGERSVYDGFRFSGVTGDDWQCNKNESQIDETGNGYGINPVGCVRDGHDIGGVLPDDQRRGGGFTWPPFKENYVYTGLQGAVVAAHILCNQGYDAWAWGEQGMLRAYQWLESNGFPATDPVAADDGWQTFIVNYHYGTSLPTSGDDVGKNMGFTEWMFGGRSYMP